MEDKAPKLGSRVQIVGKDLKGKVAFVGSIRLFAGKWFGVVLDEPKGKNNGLVLGKTYFKCPDDYRIFFRQSQIQVIEEDSGLKSTSSSFSSISSLENVISGKEASEKKRKSSNTGMARFMTDKCEKDAAEATSHTPSSSSLQSSMMESDSTQSPDLLAIKSNDGNLEFKSMFLKKDQEIDTLKTEIKNLNEKLKTLKIKRSEDQIKLRVAEKTKIQELLEYKSKIEQNSKQSLNQLIIKGAASNLEFQSMLLQKDQEINVLKAEIKDLNEKLETMTIKRSEDQIKLKQAEKVKIKVQELLEYKSKIEQDSKKSLDLLKIKSAASNLEFQSTLLQKDQEIDTLKVEIKDLNENLETQKIKRSEDQTRLKEVEKAKIQVQQLLKYKSKSIKLQANLQRQITQIKKEAKDAVEAKEQHEKEMFVLTKALEIATLRGRASENYEIEPACAELEREITQLGLQK